MDGQLPMRAVVIAALVREIVDLWWLELVANLVLRMCEIEQLFPEMMCEKKAELLDVRY